MTSFLLVVHSEPERSAPLGTMRTITDFLANVVVHVSRPRGRGIDLLEGVMSPAHTTAVAELRPLLDEIRAIRAVFTDVAIDRLVKFEMRIPQKRLTDLRTLAGRPEVTLEDLVACGVTWGEVACEPQEVDEIRNELRELGTEADSFTLAHAFSPLMASVERMAAHALESNCEMTCR